jgi:hypothetical protein
VAHCATGIERPLKLLALATLLSAALLSGLIPTIGVLILLTRGVLATLLAAVTLVHARHSLFFKRCRSCAAVSAGD